MTKKEIAVALMVGAFIGLFIAIITTPLTKNQRIQACFDKPSDNGVRYCLEYVAHNTTE